MNAPLSVWLAGIVFTALLLLGLRDRLFREMIIGLFAISTFFGTLFYLLAYFFG